MFEVTEDDNSARGGGGGVSGCEERGRPHSCQGPARRPGGGRPAAPAGGHARGQPRFGGAAGNGPGPFPQEEQAGAGG